MNSSTLPAQAATKPGLLEETGSQNITSLRGPRIRCPRCDWQPGPNDVWSCICTCQWHTFDTGGICPQCLHQWTDTQCLACQAWSAHSDWYEY